MCFASAVIKNWNEKFASIKWTASHDKRFCHFAKGYVTRDLELAKELLKYATATKTESLIQVDYKTQVMNTYPGIIVYAFLAKGFEVHAIDVDSFVESERCKEWWPRNTNGRLQEHKLLDGANQIVSLNPEDKEELNKKQPDFLFHVNNENHHAFISCSLRAAKPFLRLIKSNHV